MAASSGAADEATISGAGRGDPLVPVGITSLEDQSTCLEEQGDGDVEMMPCDPPETCWNCRTFLRYAGPGWLMSLAYLDPGNLESDLQNGAFAGYSLLWVLFLCTLSGLILQVLAARLGTVAGMNLADACRIHYPRYTSITIWIMTEVAIIGADIQEVVGTAIALNVLFGIPLWAGSLITGLDTFTFLLIHYLGKRALELFIFVLVVLMSGCFFVNFFVATPPASAIAGGFAPICPSYAQLQMVGTIGAVIMPHNIYLHSGLATTRGVDRQSQLHVHQANKYNAVDAAIALLVSFFINGALQTSFAHGFFYEPCAAADGGPYACLPDATGPPEGCSGAACSPCRTATGNTGYCAIIGLETAGDALSALFPGGDGRFAQKVFALGVLAAGQASTMTGTIAGQFVMEGFVKWRVSVWVRTLLTRAIALGPAVAVAIVTSSNPGFNNAINEYLNILQSVQLPFALLPVLHFNSDVSIMGERFVLKKRWQALCWFLGLIVIGVNVFLVWSQASEGSTLAQIVVIALLVVYFLFLMILVKSDLAAFCRCLSSAVRRRPAQPA